jgi:hypothetical protein
MKAHAIAEPTPARLPSPFKVSVVAMGLEYWPLAQAANAELPPEEQMSERTISLFATGRKLPTLRQAKILARLLHRPVCQLFPALS